CSVREHCKRHVNMKPGRLQRGNQRANFGRHKLHQDYAHHCERHRDTADDLYFVEPFRDQRQQSDSPHKAQQHLVHIRERRTSRHIPSVPGCKCVCKEPNHRGNRCAADIALDPGYSISHVQRTGACVEHQRHVKHVALVKQRSSGFCLDDIKECTEQKERHSQRDYYEEHSSCSCRLLLCFSSRHFNSPIPCRGYWPTVVVSRADSCSSILDSSCVSGSRTFNSRTIASTRAS